ncbi:metal ABC transporter ATP-binding protein [Desulfomonile tiedjei]|uniref:ATPase component of Mn/Zn ABC-type transporter n=1 Tax=Desulfomonile tiedjei (strain ATCC 49306 / DSM 6799 / DCB-1) TaxID=706587 RepID=I4C9C7_DESTA|nr:ABC transporter ATP-binding protein [Desulfomonile tiedjei]AFM26168.1 ATPase component of Mn/Zn ABC-type transporter [Desulfomonile tiedjei DSM 6799]
MDEQNSPAVFVKDLWFAYNGYPALENVNLSIPRGDFVSVVGPNGGGKTTLLKVILGLLRPTRGEVRVMGMTPEQARPRIGYMPQYTQLDPLFPATLMDVALMGRLGRGGLFGGYSREDKNVVSEALKQVGLYELRKKSFSALSGGQRQRLLIARALACEPDLLLLDEPAANLDAVMETDLYQLLRTLNERLTIMMVSHDLGFVSRIIKSVICVKRKVLMHPTTEITGEIINDIYGSPMRMIRHNGEGDSICSNL